MVVRGNWDCCFLPGTAPEMLRRHVHGTARRRGRPDICREAAVPSSLCGVGSKWVLYCPPMLNGCTTSASIVASAQRFEGLHVNFPKSCETHRVQIGPLQTFRGRIFHLIGGQSENSTCMPSSWEVKVGDNCQVRYLFGGQHKLQ